MTCELFRGRKQKQKHTQKCGKKNHNKVVIKKGAPQNPNDWPMNFSLEKLTKNTTLEIKKKTRFCDLNERMVYELISGNKKVRYLWLY